ncbi:hypothetical protein [Streptomyces rubradiris]|uniref:Uncharacterized protein n=1 Tax=Streptomyces rubradiris TaxID=285531 RepID=A0ABQ3RQE3_STRRR|nr:hypothetical protein [Streptomyces rubradiris]GHH29105.1 hypothetical protein GCM10018792_73720 [Streptomyces rubradiris]GHI58068.1 hypothetical protein Srubr_79140 [Streptomyces rubradiris]
MSRLMRSPKERGSWYWDLDDFAEPGLESALSVAARMCDVLERAELLFPSELRYNWYVLGAGTTGVTSVLELAKTPLGDPGLPERVRGTRPTAHPSADIADFEVLGGGTWIGEGGHSHTEYRLVDLSLSTAPTGLSAELSVHHDIWGLYDFAGRPHPEIHQNNAPRLAAVLRDLTELFGMPPEPGERTYFGASAVDGVVNPEPDQNGLGPDLTSRL